MRRLGGEDTGFLLMEVPEQPMNSMMLGLLRPPAGPDGRPRPHTPATLRTHMARILGDLPAYRWRVEEVPLGLDQPVYIDDPDFDLDYHLRHLTLEPPGTRGQLDAAFAAVAATQLDPRHPLWQTTLVDGLDDGRQAVIHRYHHCLADGVAGVTTLSRIFSGPERPVSVPAGDWAPEPVPTGARLVADALRHRARLMRALPPLVRAASKGLPAARRHRAELDFPVPKPGEPAPRCALLDAHTAPRAYGRASLSLADVRAVKDAAGVTVNDVALAVVGGALRRYLGARDDLPAPALRASVPVANEPPGAPERQWGNHFSALTTTLATDVADPWARLAEIHRVTTEAKRLFDLSGSAAVPEWLDHVPPFLAGWVVRAMQRDTVQGKRTPEVNVLLSNLRGPAEPWHFDEAVVEELYLVGPPSIGVGLNVLVWSYAGRLLVTTLAFASALAAPDELARDYEVALAELVALAADRRSPVPHP